MLNPGHGNCLLFVRVIIITTIIIIIIIIVVVELTKLYNPLLFLYNKY